MYCRFVRWRCGLSLRGGEGAPASTLSSRCAAVLGTLKLEAWVPKLSVLAGDKLLTGSDAVSSVVEVGKEGRGERGKGYAKQVESGATWTLFALNGALCWVVWVGRLPG